MTEYRTTLGCPRCEWTREGDPTTAAWGADVAAMIDHVKAHRDAYEVLTDTIREEMGRAAGRHGYSAVITLEEDARGPHHSFKYDGGTLAATIYASRSLNGDKAHLTVVVMASDKSIGIYEVSAAKDQEPVYRHLLRGIFRSLRLEAADAAWEATPNYEEARP